MIVFLAFFRSKFFELPPGSKKPPPQQGKLDAAWKKQTKRADKGASGEAEEVPLGSVKEEKASSKVVPEVKTAAPAGDVVMANGEGSAEEKDTSETESDKGSAKGKQTELVDEGELEADGATAQTIAGSNIANAEPAPHSALCRADQRAIAQKATGNGIRLRGRRGHSEEPQASR